MSNNYVFSSTGVCISNSHNLRGVLDHAAKQNGVKAIRVFQLFEGPTRPGAFLEIHYATGAIGETYFVDGSHAIDWARRQSALSPRVSWWSGCQVSEIRVPAGAWPWEEVRPSQAYAATV